MRVHFQLFLFITLAISRVHMSPQRRQPPNHVQVPYGDYELYLKEFTSLEEEIPDEEREERLTDGKNFRQQLALRQLAQAEVEAQQAQIDREAILAQIDRAALSKISEADRELLLSKLTQAEREALLTEFEEGELSEVLPIEENRFGFMAAGGLAGAVAKIGAGAGGYIGGKLAGAFGAKLGAAAGAYLGAAAASRLNFGSKKNKTPPPQNDSNGSQFGTSYGGGFGAVLVNKK